MPPVILACGLPESLMTCASSRAPRPISDVGHRVAKARSLRNARGECPKPYKCESWFSFDHVALKPCLTLHGTLN